MLDLIDQTIEAFFRAAVPLSATDVDVSFEAPNREWSSKLTRPTVNVFLWDIRRSVTRARTGMEEIERNGHVRRRLALPIIELRYVVSAWTSDHGDERALLGGLMRTILRHGEVPPDLLPPGLVELRTPTVLMARAGEDHIDLLKALDGQLKPGIHMTFTSEVDIDRDVPVGPPVDAVSLDILDTTGTARSSIRRVAGEALIDGAVGAVVRGPRSSVVVNRAGRFLIEAVAGETLVLTTVPERTVVVPSAGGVRFE